MLANLLFLTTGHRIKFLLIAIFAVFSSVLELIGVGMLIPIVFIKFLPVEHEVSGRLIKVFEIFGLEYGAESITILLVGFVCVLILRSVSQVGFSFLSGKMLGHWKSTSSALLLRNHMVAQLELQGAHARQQLQSKLNAVSKFIDKAASAVFELFTSIIIIFCFVMALLIINPAIALAALTTLLMLAGIRYLLIKSNKVFDAELDYSLAESKKNTIDNAVNLIKEIKVFRREDFFYNQYNYLNRRMIALSKRIKTVSLLPDIFTQIALVSSLAVIIFFSEGISNYLSGEMVAFTIFVVLRLMPRISRFQKNLLTIGEGKIGGEILKNAIRQNEEYETSRMAIEYVPVKEFIELENIGYSFQIDGKQKEKIFLFKNINLKIGRGEFIGIVGPSGHGKTTLLEIISGIRKPTSGFIKIDGQKLMASQRPWLGIGYLSQNAIILNGGLTENITFGLKKFEINRKLVKSLIAELGLIKLVSNRTLNSHLNGSIDHYSAGEKQRVGLARSLYAANDLLLLDEPTSNLDYASEASMLETLKKRQKNLTIIMVAHRLNTLQNCDKIIEVKDGEVTVMKNK